MMNRTKNHLNEEKLAELREVFQGHDKDNDGFIVYKDLSTIIRGYGFLPSEIELVELLKTMDKGEDSLYDFKDLLKILNGRINEPREEELLEAFKALDREETGLISNQELKNILASLSDRISDSEIEEIIDYCYLDKDDRINYEEFVRMMLSK